jgi:hypothetical protein
LLPRECLSVQLRAPGFRVLESVDPWPSSPIEGARKVNQEKVASDMQKCGAGVLSFQ